MNGLLEKIYYVHIIYPDPCFCPNRGKTEILTGYIISEEIECCGSELVNRWYDLEVAVPNYSYYMSPTKVIKKVNSKQVFKTKKEAKKFARDVNKTFKQELKKKVDCKVATLLSEDKYKDLSLKAGLKKLMMDGEIC